MATLDDYAAVRHHLGLFFSEGVDATIGADVRETVETVALVIERKAALGGSPDARASYKEVADELGLDKATGRRRALKALNAGFLKNTARPHKEAELGLGLPLPSAEDDVQLLPDPSQVERRRSEWQ